MKVLITGAGGPAAIAFFKSVTEMPGVEPFMGDMNPFSTGLYLVDEAHRVVLPAGADESFSDFVLDFCRNRSITVVVPTVDCELAPLARREADFDRAGIALMASPLPALEACNDKLTLMERLEGKVALAAYRAYEGPASIHPGEYPVIVKARNGSGGTGVHVARRPEDLSLVPTDGSYMVQEYLPGTEYSVDVYIDRDRRVLASVIRERIRVDSGVAIIARTIHDPAMSELAREIALEIGIRHVANVQFKRDADGQPRLLEINPRFPGTMPLTVAAGADMPKMCLREAAGETLDEVAGYRAIAMVRHWEETFLPENTMLAA